MARGIVVNLGGEASTFALTKVEREKLYGRKVNIVVDETGAQAQGALLTADGTALVPSGGTSSVYLTDAFDTIERSELRAVDSDGKPVPQVPSTLGVEQPLKGPVDARRVLDCAVSSVYQLLPEAIGPGLEAQLAAGKIFETTFNYRDGYDSSVLFLLRNDGGTFALVSDPSPFEYLQKDAPPASEDAADDLEGDLDFSMM